MSLISKIALITAVLLASLLIFSDRVVYASPSERGQTDPTPGDFFLIVLADANDKGVLPDSISELLADYFIERLISPATGETLQQVEDRLSVNRAPYAFLVAVIADANDKGVLPDSMSELLADYFIEYMIAPATGETPELVRERLSAQAQNRRTPKVSLAFDKSATTVSGYWFDGTASAEIVAFISKDDDLPYSYPWPIVVTCTQDGEVVSGCGGDLKVALPDGHGPISQTLSLRVPMGKVDLAFDYGGDTVQALTLNVPERIIGVDRETWKCYSDRSPTEYEQRRYFYGCYGWYSETVQKWRSGSTGKGMGQGE